MSKRITDDKVIAALMANNTVSAAAASLGMGTRTLFTRLENPEFKAKFDRMQRETITAACTALTARVTGAIDTMDEVMQNSENSPQTRLSAARAILDYAMKAAEIVDIQHRLDELEQREKARNSR